MTENSDIKLIQAVTSRRQFYQIGYNDGKNDACRKIIKRLEEAKGVCVDKSGKMLYQEDYFIDIDDAIEIVKEVELND